MSLPLEHVVVDRLEDARAVVVAERLASRRSPWMTRNTAASASSVRFGVGRPHSSSVAFQAPDLEDEVVTGLGRRPGARGLDGQRRVGRAELVDTRGHRHGVSVFRSPRPTNPEQEHRHGPRARPFLHHRAPARRELVDRPRSRAARAVRAGRLGARADRRRRGQGADRREAGRDVDDLHRHGRGRRAGSRRSTERSWPSSRARRAARATPTRRSRFTLSRRAAARSTPTAQITGKAASMGEGVVAGVLDALMKDFASNLGKL